MSLVGNDILDIGSRKARRQRGGFGGIPELAMGSPGQFDLPNVPDVSCDAKTYVFFSNCQLLKY